jgi:hypothetical protein
MYAGGTMDDTKNMLRAIINGQSALKEELLNRIDKLEHKVDGKHESLIKKIDGVDLHLTEVETNLTKRIDKIGLQLARLEDDSPTREEFDDLGEKVDRLERVRASS